MRAWWIWGLILALTGPAAAVHAAEPGGWEELAFLPWGDGPEQVGRTLPRSDELVLGPHGLALAGNGEVAVVDRVNGRALVLSADGAVLRELAVPGRPGAAALLPDGTLAVLDENQQRRVRLMGGLSGELHAPAWALPPSRLTVHTDAWGRVVLQGLDAFQLQQPLTPFPVAPARLTRGVPGPDGAGAVWVVRDGGETILQFAEGSVVLDPSLWPAADAGFAPGAVDVLAAGPDGAVVMLESVSGDEGPLEVERAVVRVDAQGVTSPPLALPAVGPVAIPLDLAATAGGEVRLLVSDADGCWLLRTDLSASEEVAR